MKRYERYKDCGVQWIGEIPEHWKTVRLGHISVLKTGTTPSFYESEINGNFVNWYTPSDFGENFELSESLRKLDKKSFEEAGYSYIPANSILMIGIGGTAGKTSLAAMDCYTNQQITSIMPKTIIESEYLLLYLRTQRTILLKTAHYTTLPILNNAFLSQIVVPLPIKNEQHAIVDYLKDKTLKIDQYVAARERERELLDSLKQSEIANIVTKGLNPNAPMKDSGIPWIGLIPEHWEVKKIRTCFKERREKVSDKDYEALSVSKLGVTPQLDSAVKTDNGDNRKKVCKGDFVVNSRSDRKGSCGFSEYEGSVSLINIVLTPFNVFGRYYHYLFRSNDYIEEFYRQGRGIVADLWTTRYSEMKNIYIPVPPLSEQQAIVTYIDEKLAKIDSCLADLQAEIDYLKEFKQRLISDAVTGQICVTDSNK